MTRGEALDILNRGGHLEAAARTVAAFGWRHLDLGKAATVLQEARPGLNRGEALKAARQALRPLCGRAIQLLEAAEGKAS